MSITTVDGRPGLTAVKHINSYSVNKAQYLRNNKKNPHEIKINQTIKLQYMNVTDK